MLSNIEQIPKSIQIHLQGTDKYDETNFQCLNIQKQQMKFKSNPPDEVETITMRFV